MKREFISQGFEHKVWRSKRNRRIVLKTPTWANRISLLLTGTRTSDLKDEIKEAQERIGGIGEVRIPETRIFGFFGGLGYVIAQPYIDTDHEDFAEGTYEKIVKQNDVLAKLYWLSPQNFRITNDVAYFIDPTKGVIGRILDRFGILSFDGYVRALYQIKRRF